MFQVTQFSYLCCVCVRLCDMSSFIFVIFMRKISLKISTWWLSQCHSQPRKGSSFSFIPWFIQMLCRNMKFISFSHHHHRHDPHLYCYCDVFPYKKSIFSLGLCYLRMSNKKWYPVKPVVVHSMPWSALWWWISWYFYHIRTWIIRGWS